MKIVIPILGFGKSGGYRVLSKLADHFISRGYEVTFVAPYFSDKPYYPTKAKIFWAASTGVDYGLPGKEEKKGGFLKIMYCLYKALKNINASADTIILANHSLTTLPVYLSKTKGKKVYYIQAYEPEYYEILPGIKNKLLAYLSKLSYSLPFQQVVNSHLYCNYKEIKSDKIVYPGIDLSVFYPKQMVEPPQKPRKWRIGTIFREELQKGTAYALEAFEILNRQRDDMEFILAFAPAEYKGTNIHVVQPHGDSELATFYRSLDIYISAGTIQQGAVHYPVIESMACGTVVVTTSYYPANEENAYIVPIKDATAIAKAVVSAISNSHEFFWKQSKAVECVTRFAWDTVGDKMIAAFKETDELKKVRI